MYNRILTTKLKIVIRIDWYRQLCCVILWSWEVDGRKLTVCIWVLPVNCRHFWCCTECCGHWGKSTNVYWFEQRQSLRYFLLGCKDGRSNWFSGVSEGVDHFLQQALNANFWTPSRASISLVYVGSTLDGHILDMVLWMLCIALYLCVCLNVLRFFYIRHFLASLHTLVCVDKDWSDVKYTPKYMNSETLSSEQPFRLIVRSWVVVLKKSEANQANTVNMRMHMTHLHLHRGSCYVQYTVYIAPHSNLYNCVLGLSCPKLWWGFQWVGEGVAPRSYP